ncbi:MAG TPA: ATP-dependent metallopeptidase FtsH/Yme1/Tma family protein, partial [Gaiellaceae bacterium]|nr:ATP-dependent metallopeptidase FtsH/Yme1/Tma family protein [Gaiellaceae bacterium]
MNRFFRSALFPLVVIILLVWLATQTLIPRSDNTQKLTYSQVRQEVKSGDVSDVEFNPSKQEITGKLSGGEKFKVNYPTPQSQIEFENLLQQNDVRYDSKGVGSSPWWSILTSLLPFVLLIGFWIFLMNQVQGGGSKVMSFGKSRAKRMAPDSPKIGFKDVAGV